MAGFADGEGSFSVAIIKHPTQKFGWMIDPSFHVYQHEKHREILELFQFQFGTGQIYRKSGVHPVLNFSVDSRKSILERVIPFFQKYPLITKADEFRRFCSIVMAMERKEHWTREGFAKIVGIAYAMNQQGKGRKHPKSFILSTIGVES